VRSLAAASPSDEFQRAIFRKFLEHISVFLGHPVVVIYTQSLSFRKQLANCEFLPVLHCLLGDDAFAFEFAFLFVTLLAFVPMLSSYRWQERR